jgi:hypothetical protein
MRKGEISKAEFEKATSVLFKLLELIHSDDFRSVYPYDNVFKLRKIIENIIVGSETDFKNLKEEFAQFIFKYIEPLHDKLFELVGGKYGKFGKNVLNKEIDIIIEEYEKFESYYIFPQISQEHSINSYKYYEDKIEELEKKEIELKERLEIVNEINQEEVYSAKFEAEEANKKLIELRKQLEQKQKQDDAKSNWESNINSTFEFLKDYLKPIKDEQRRLNVLFWVYLVMSTLLVIAVIIIECIAVCHIGSMPNLPDFKTYILIYLPLPVAGALLWGFIYQMNRAQRQLVAIAKSIHKVEYVQGLLLSINKLAPTVEDGIIRINAALDKLINNHLNEKEVNTEEDIIKEEKKDVVPVESLIKILKEVNKVVGKE